MKLEKVKKQIKANLQQALSFLKKNVNLNEVAAVLLLVALTVSTSLAKLSHPAALVVVYV